MVRSYKEEFEIAIAKNYWIGEESDVFIVFQHGQNRYGDATPNIKTIDELDQMLQDKGLDFFRYSYDYLVDGIIGIQIVESWNVSAMVVPEIDEEQARNTLLNKFHKTGIADTAKLYACQMISY